MLAKDFPVITPSLQSTYDASGTPPHVILTAARGALTIRDNATPIGDLFDVQDNGGSSILKVSPSELLVATNITVSGTVDGRDVSADGAVLDAHVADTANPHSTSLANIDSGTLAQLNAAISDANVPPEARTITAGAGLTGGGDLSADRTIDVVANGDGSIVVNANDVQVGVLATDAQHGVRGGGTQHAIATGAVAGFMSAADKTTFDAHLNPVNTSNPHTVTLQQAYVAGEQVTVDNTNGALHITDDGTLPAATTQVFCVNDSSGNPRINSVRDYLDLGFHDSQTTSVEPILRLESAAPNSIQWWPTDRTFIATPGALMRTGNVYTHDYLNVSVAVLNIQNTHQHNQAGGPFNHGLIFNHGSTYRNELNNAVNYGPVQGFIDQPTIQVNRSTAGTITMGLFRSFLSQPRFQRASTNGTLSITTAANFQGFGAVETGTTIGTFSRAALGPFATFTGTVTQMYGVDIANETGPTNVTAIRIQQNSGSGTRRAIDVSGTAVSTFGGTLHMNNSIALNLGSVGSNGVQLIRTSAGVMRMIGVGGTNNEGLDWSLDAAPNVVSVSSSTGVNEMRWGIDKWHFGSTGAIGNQQFNFTANARSTGVAGEWADVLLTQAANITIDHAMSLVAGWVVNAPSMTIGSGSVTDAAAMRIGGNVNQGTNRYGLHILSNPSGGGGLNHSLRTAGSVLFDDSLQVDGNIGFYGTTPVAQSAAYTPTNVSTDRAYDANSTTLDEVADVLGTLIADLQATGIIG